ncbi:hypothetical protein BHE74_00030488 [Ensete ventricosum]|nr:hypothetical protein BHE74_00030488 [Ensete ventricosum]RZR75615.1 hypothetical protein BHM03_00000029 [Ensete ventricosum]
MVQAFTMDVLGSPLALARRYEIPSCKEKGRLQSAQIICKRITGLRSKIQKSLVCSPSPSKRSHDRRGNPHNLSPSSMRGNQESSRIAKKHTKEKRISPKERKRTVGFEADPALELLAGAGFEVDVVGIRDGDGRNKRGRVPRIRHGLCV